MCLLLAAAVCIFYQIIMFADISTGIYRIMSFMRVMSIIKNYEY